MTMLLFPLVGSLGPRLRRNQTFMIKAIISTFTLASIFSIGLAEVSAKGNSKELALADIQHIDQDNYFTDLAERHEDSVDEVKDRKSLIKEGVRNEPQIKKEKKSASKPKAETKKENIEKTVTVKATAYTAHCEGCIGITKTGVDLLANPDERVIAVDPSVIPLGSRVYIEGYGYAKAEDTGGAIKGNRIDIYMEHEKDALAYGVKEGIEVKIID